MGKRVVDVSFDLKLEVDDCSMWLAVNDSGELITCMNKMRYYKRFSEWDYNDGPTHRVFVKNASDTQIRLPEEQPDWSKLSIKDLAWVKCWGKEYLTNKVKGVSYYEHSMTEARGYFVKEDSTGMYAVLNATGELYLYQNIELVEYHK